MYPQEKDSLDKILEQWNRERPDLDVSPMGIIGRISRLSRILEGEIEQTFASYGLPRGGFDVLAALRRAGPPFQLSPTGLYNSLLISSGTTTNRVDRLEESGLVSRIPDPNDRRGILVALTGKGKRLVDKVTTSLVENEMSLLSHLRAGERRQLEPLLRNLLLGLERPLEDYEDAEATTV